MLTGSALPDYVHESVHALPPLPAAVQRLLVLAQQPEADFREIADVIVTDQTLTARTLRAANSALYALPRRVQTVQQATVLLGRDTLTSLAVGAAVLSLQSQVQHAWPADPQGFWRHSMGVALATRMLARPLGLQDAEEAFVAGLLHDIGKLVLLNYFGDIYAQVVLAAQYGTKPLHLLERELFEVDHAAVGQALCRHWNIPPALTRAVAEHHDADDPAPGTAAAAVRYANDFVKALQLGSSGNRYVECRPRPYDRISPLQLHALAMELPGQVRQAEVIFAPGAPGDVPGPRVRPLVHLQMAQTEERELMELALWTAGYEPVRLSEAEKVEDVAAGRRELAGCVSDRPQNAVRLAAYRMYGVPVLDYAAWRNAEASLTEPHAFDVVQLYTWLTQQLAPGAAAAVG